VLDLLQTEQKALLDRIERLNPDLGSLLRVNPLNGKEVQTLLDKTQSCWPTTQVPSGPRLRADQR